MTTRRKLPFLGGMSEEEVLEVCAQEDLTLLEDSNSSSGFSHVRLDKRPREPGNKPRYKVYAWHEQQSKCLGNFKSPTRLLYVMLATSRRTACQGRTLSRSQRLA